MKVEGCAVYLGENRYTGFIACDKCEKRDSCSDEFLEKNGYVKVVLEKRISFDEFFVLEENK